MNSDEIILLIIGIVFVGTVIIIAILALRGNTYTLDEWNRQCEEDFKKYGPPPED